MSPLWCSCVLSLSSSFSLDRFTPFYPLTGAMEIFKLHISESKVCSSVVDVKNQKSLFHSSVCKVEWSACWDSIASQCILFYIHISHCRVTTEEKRTVFFLFLWQKIFFSSRYAALHLDEAIFLNFRSIFSSVIALETVVFLMAEVHRGVIIAMLIILNWGAIVSTALNTSSIDRHKNFSSFMVSILTLGNGKFYLGPPGGWCLYCFFILILLWFNVSMSKTLRE